MHQSVFRPVLHRLVLVLVLASGSVAAQVTNPASQAGSVRVAVLPRLDGTMNVWEISRERLVMLPRWDPKGKMPLSHADAVRVAEKHATDQNAGVSGWQVFSSALLPLVVGGDGNPTGSTLASWYYRVQLAPEVGVPEAYLPGVAGDARRITVVVLLDGSVVESRIDKNVTALTQGRGGPSPVPGTSDVYTVGAGVVSPRVISNPKPAYTAEAMRRRIQGTVVMQAVVDIDGQCKDITVVRSLDKEYGLDEQAISTASRWRFEPATLNGKPVKVRIVIELDFNLKDGPAPANK